jgi:predicted metal-dependent RNase
VDEKPQTPKADSINVANLYDWQQRAYQAEQELQSARTKLERERRRSVRSQCQTGEYVEALARSSQDYAHVMEQCRALSSTNLGLAQELGKAKIMVETLEAVLMMLWGISPDKALARKRSQTNEGCR